MADTCLAALFTSLRCPPAPPGTHPAHRGAHPPAWGTQALLHEDAEPTPLRETGVHGHAPGSWHPGPSCWCHLGWWLSPPLRPCGW